MTRRRRLTRKRAPHPGVQLAQIVGLVLLLVGILFFRNRIATSAGALFDAFGQSEDVKVSPDEPNAASPDASYDAKKSER